MARLGISACLVLQVLFAGSLLASVRLAKAKTSYTIKVAAPADASKSAGSADGAAPAEGGWRLIPPSMAATKKIGAAVLRTAEFDRSDPRFAGLMLQCGSAGIDSVIIVVEPYPPHVRPQITLRTTGKLSEFAGSVIPTGAGIRIPLDAAQLTALGLVKNGEVELSVLVEGVAMNGTVSLRGFAGALEWLKVECSEK